jgi:hypothetical protein
MSFIARLASIHRAAHPGPALRASGACRWQAAEARDAATAAKSIAAARTVDLMSNSDESSGRRL